MAKLIVAILFLSFGIAQASGLKLELLAESSLPKKVMLDKVAVGGLSGIYWDGQHLLAVSDDRGKSGPPRFYELDLTIKNSGVDFTPKKSIAVKGISLGVLDMEGIARLPNGDLVLSSEGDNNAKPRAMPKIFFTSPNGDLKSELTLPEKFLPEALGEQKKGIENNRGFEGLTSSADGQSIYIMNEAPLLTDRSAIEDTSEWMRLVHFVKDKDTYKVEEELPYVLDIRTQNNRGPEVYRGVSEILYWKDRKFITLERGVRVSAKGIAYSGSLYFTDFQGTKDVSKIANLTEGKVSSPRKEKLFDLETLSKDPIENFEGLAWGPNLSDGRKTLLVISDNNFSSREKTQLLVFTVKEVE